MNDREKYFKDVIENYKTMANDLAASRTAFSEETSKNMQLQYVSGYLLRFTAVCSTSLSVLCAGRPCVKQRLRMSV